MRSGSSKPLSTAVPAVLSGLLLLPACSDGESESPGENASDYMPLMSNLEAGEIMQDCMTEHGWEVELNEFNEIESSHEEAQADQYQADLESCWAEHGFDKPPPPMDRDTAGEFFDLVVESAGCLEDLGYSISEPPGREDYIEALVSTNGAIWDPYADIVESTTPEEWDEARRSCPQPERPDLDE
ncbi:hypothetical protein [Glycomyces salinus]|uniref:hypothetical protein n=1 Tax=Glycomyces salinus TaxID=980294 RepID=UPI0018EB6D1E|nr:hypothetical protein [Glycomyces salinus]